MPFDLPAERVLPLLESRERAGGMDARPAWDWLTANGDVPEVTLRGLESFLWYQLPAKFLTTMDEHRAIALALGDLLDDLGYADGAALCRGPVTMHVLAEWEKGPGSGRRALRKALDESGVEPPDTVDLAWGGIMGPIEARLMTLMEFAKQATLVRRNRTSLRLTELGGTAVTDPAVLWDVVVRVLAARSDFASAIRELLLVRLLRGAADRDVVKDEILPVLSEAGWRPSEGGELTREMLSFQLWDAIRPMDLLGMFDVGEWPDRGLHLTEFGANTARTILWHRAREPRQSLG